MCGLAGMIGLNGRPVDETALERMAFSLQHRGPDDKGIYVNGAVGFGFRRLSILDLSPGGHQPKVSRDGKIAIVFNGEIYNYIELRAELTALGHSFESSGDTEVLLAAYREWGPDCLSRLNGMWAFLIHDVAKKKIFGSRDRFGVKPLYRYVTNDMVLFGSESKAILESGYYQPRLNWNVATAFLLRNRLDVDTQTFYEGIEQVPAGSAFELFFDGQYRSWAFWSLDDIPMTQVQDPVEVFKDLFDDAVRIRMRSDVPVGVCLSGGLDSTSILCSMAKRKTASGHRLQAFSYMSKEYDESRYIADTIQWTGAQLNRLELDPALLIGKLEKVLWYHDGPVHSMTALVGFELMGLAARTGIKVILNGQGADETIAGYHSYFGSHWSGMIRTGQWSKAWSEMNDHSAALGSDPKRAFLRAVIPLLTDGISQSSVYRRIASHKQRKHLNHNGWFTADFVERCRPEEAIRNRSLDDDLKASVRRDPLPLFLRIEDRNSMAHSIEARVPFLDYRLVTLLFGLGAEWKMRGAWNKYILRQAMAGRIPESVRMRADKMGFPVPGKHWLAGALYEPFQDLLASREMREAGIYNVAKIGKDLESNRLGMKDESVALFNVAQFQMWSNRMHSAVQLPVR